MEYLKPYKVVFTRIGDQESWAGWRIAGYTENTPSDVLAQCGKLQAKNADKAKFMYDKYHKEHIDEAREVYEFTCDLDGQEGKVFSFTKQIFGDSDSGRRTNMVASSICVPIYENEDVLHYPQLLLAIDRTCFDDCQLDAELLNKAAGKINYGLTEVQTLFPFKDYSSKKVFNITKEIDNVFGNREIYRNFIRCIYWNLTFKSASSIFIKSEGGLDYNINIFLIAINSVVYSFRSKMSFRTFDLEDPTNQPTLVFSKSIPNGVRFFDLKTGINNILTESVVNKLNRQFMEYYPTNIDDERAEKYFELLDTTLLNFGSRNATEIPLLETAFAITQNELEENVDQSDQEIIKRIITFCNLPYSNDKIDSYIAKLLDSIIIGDIFLNDDIKNYIDKKLSNTKCTELIEIGNQYRARNLLKEGKTNAFKRLLKIKSEDLNYNKIIEYIMLEPIGESFIDEFYGMCYGPQVVTTMNDLIGFVREVKNYHNRTQINKFIKEKTLEFGEDIVHEFFNNQQSLVQELDKYEQDLSQIYSMSSGAVSSILKRIGYLFWEEFSFDSFSIKSVSSYQKVRFSDIRTFPKQTQKCGLAYELIDIFKVAEKQNINTIRSFKNKIEESTLLDDKAIKHLIRQFRYYCIDMCDKRHYIDFWLALGDLDVRSRFDFYFDNDIRILTSPNRFDVYIEKSKLLSNFFYLENYRDGLESYRKLNDSQDVADILDIVKQFESEIRKELKYERKKEKKLERKHLEHVQTKPKHGPDMAKDKRKNKNKEVDFVTGNETERDGSSKPSGGKFSFGFKNPFNRK